MNLWKTRPLHFQTTIQIPALRFSKTWSAICIQPLTSQQVNLYFDRAGDQLSALKTILLQDEVLQELATLPLMLSIMSLAYQGSTAEQLTLSGKADDYRKCGTTHIYLFQSL